VFKTVVPFKASAELIFKDLVIIDFLENQPTVATQAFQTIQFLQNFIILS
jgi:hypothetical protein